MMKGIFRICLFAVAIGATSTACVVDDTPERDGDDGKLDDSPGDDDTDDDGDEPDDDYQACVDRVLALCDELELDGDRCEALIRETCRDPGDDGGGGSCDDPDPDCWTTAYDECVAGGGCEESCVTYADEVCAEPVPDDCWIVAWDRCIESGGSDEECAAVADQACGGGDDPGEPMPDQPDQPCACDDATPAPHR
jgi:hypothetical protein